jgi:hypothetical protein
MKHRLSLPAGARRRGLLVLAAFGFCIATIATTPDLTRAGSSGGRVYNPKALRVKKEAAQQGRQIRRPNPQVRDGQPLRRSYAVIPDPRPARRGGSSYNRNGRYFYEKPKPITMSKRNWNTRSYKDTVPNPTYFRRAVHSRVP